MKIAASKGRPLAVITGACGGMGVACARVMGRHHRLVLADINAERLEALRDDLCAGGVVIAGLVSGNIADPSTIDALATAVGVDGPLGALVHTAGLSPALAGWKAIVEVNFLAVVRLLDALEPHVGPGAAAVLMASVAAHTAMVDPAIDTLFDHPGDPDFLDRLEPLLRGQPGADSARGLGVASYNQSKRALLRLCRGRAASWGVLGARIVTISPGWIATSMSHREFAESATALERAEQTPAGRWGTPLDIANVAEFLASDLASFITGTDIRVDGGRLALAGL